MVSDDEARKQMALFRYGLIADLLHRQPGEKGLYALLHEKAQKSYDIPPARAAPASPPRRCAIGSRRTGAAASMR